MDALRWILAIVTFVAVYFFSFWMFFGQLVPPDIPYLADLLSIAAAAGSAYFVFSQLREEAGSGFLRATLLGAAIFGSVGFALGFFGPMLLAPDSNQGPLLGLFITGPGGAVLGALAGGGWWFFRYLMSRR